MNFTLESPLNWWNRMVIHKCTRFTTAPNRKRETRLTASILFDGNLVWIQSTHSIAVRKAKIPGWTQPIPQRAILRLRQVRYTDSETRGNTVRWTCPESYNEPGQKGKSGLWSSWSIPKSALLVRFAGVTDPCSFCTRRLGSWHTQD